MFSVDDYLPAVHAIRDRAFELGWSPQELYSTSVRPDLKGLVALLAQGDSIHEVTSTHIAIKSRSGNVLNMYRWPEHRFTELGDDWANSIIESDWFKNIYEGRSIDSGIEIDAPTTLKSKSRSTRHSWDKLREHVYECKRCLMAKINECVNGKWVTTFKSVDGIESTGKTPLCPGAV